MNYSQKLFDEILRKGIDKNFTDIHMQPMKETVLIYLRIEGVRKKEMEISNSSYQALLNFLKFIAHLDIGDIQHPQDGSLEYQINNQLYNLRISTLPTLYGESLAIRTLTQKKLYTLRKLFLFNYQYKQLKRMMNFDSGLVLFSGATNSGKTTLMYSILETIYAPLNKQIITLEDPIERPLHFVHQLEINERVNLTFESGLKAILRHDPDLILLGEIRDQETAEYAFRAALTGHLVLSTVHASNVNEVFLRLEDLGVSRLLIQQTLRLIANLELVNVKSCKRRAVIAEFYEKGKSYADLSHLKMKAKYYGYI